MSGRAVKTYMDSAKALFDKKLNKKEGNLMEIHSEKIYCYKCNMARPLVSGGRCEKCYKDDLSKCNNKIAVSRKLVEEVLGLLSRYESIADIECNYSEFDSENVKSKLEELLK